MENILLSALDAYEICSEGIEFIRENYSNDIDVESSATDLLVFKEICLH